MKNRIHLETGNNHQPKDKFTSVFSLYTFNVFLKTANLKNKHYDKFIAKLNLE